MSRSRVTRAFVRADRQALWNQYWRFSAWKKGAFLLIGQLAAVLGFGYFVDAVAIAPRTVGLALMVQATLSGLMGGFSSGQRRLFSNRFMDMVLVSSAPASGVLLAEFVRGVVDRAWSAVLWAVLFVGIFSTIGVLAGVGLWALGFCVGLLAYATGLLTVVACARLTPRAMGALWAVFLSFVLAGLLLATFSVVRGVELSAVARRAASYEAWVFWGTAVIGWLPGLMFVAGGLLASSLTARFFRDAWLRLAEEGAGGVRGASRWPALAPGAVGALQAKEWLQASRNTFTVMRLVLWVMLLAALLATAPIWTERIGEHLDAMILALSAGLGLFGIGEVVAASFDSDGVKMTLASICGLSPGRWLGGKLMAALPVPFVCFVSASVACFGAEMTWAMHLRLSGFAGLVGVGMANLLVGGAASGAELKGDEASRNSGVMAALFEQIPQSKGAWAGLLAAIAYAVAAVWGYETAGFSWLLIALCTIAPLWALVPGYIRLRSIIRNGLSV